MGIRCSLSKLLSQLLIITSAVHMPEQPSFYKGKEHQELSAQVRCVPAGRYFVL